MAGNGRRGGRDKHHLTPDEQARMANLKRQAELEAALRSGRAVIKQVPIKQLRYGPEYLAKLSADELRTHIKWRMNRNMSYTGHPLHHLTADGTVVDADPTLEYLLRCLARQTATTVPADRKHYGFALYESQGGEEQVDG